MRKGRIECSHVGREGSNPSLPTVIKKEIIMDIFIPVTLAVLGLGFYIYGLFRREERLQAIERKISEANDRYLVGEENKR